MRLSRRRLTGVAAALVLHFAILAGAGPAADDAPWGLLDGLQVAWKARDVAAYLRLWELATPQAEEAEKEFAMLRFGADATEIALDRPASSPAGVVRLGVTAQIFSVTEPRARVEQWRFVLEKRASGWLVVDREAAGQVEGLLHLSLDPGGFRADGLTLRLPDFELQMTRGTLFTSPENLGPTVLVFVGDATVRFRPKPPAERDQLRQFCGRTEMVEGVKAAFVRIHPADLRRVLFPYRFEPDPEARRRVAVARRFYREHETGSFLLDAALPRSPWWLLPGLGDSLVTFETTRRRTLTFTVSAGDAEAISLTDRTRRRQICLYPAGDGDIRYDEDDGRSVDVLHHDLRVRFEPARRILQGEDTIRMRLLTPASVIRLRLDDALRVDSIASREGGKHLFFRVRDRDSLMVSLGPLAGRVGEVTLTVRYGGALEPDKIDREVIQTTEPRGGAQGRFGLGDEGVPIEDVLVYSNRNVWYPVAEIDDHALATLHLDVPRGFTAVTGGTRASVRAEADRRLVEYRQDHPGRYITVVVGRLVEVGVRQDGSMRLQGFGVARTRGDTAETLETAGEILRFYETEFGPPPYSNLSLVLIEGRTPGGHSPPGMILVSRRPLMLRGSLRDDPGNFSDVPGFFLAHELAHQWWGHGVAGQNYHERWLSEGLAQYAATLWVRHAQGEEAFRSLMGRIGRWALQETDEGPISLGSRLGHIKGDPQIYRAVVYDKGAYVLQMLRGIAGDGAFRNALIAFQAGHRFKKAGTDDLRAALEEASGRDLSGYFQEWVSGTALPTLVWSQRSESGSAYRTLVDVRAENLPGPVPLEIAVEHGLGREVKRVNLSPQGGSWSIETPSRPGRVLINEDRGLLAKVRRR